MTNYSQAQPFRFKRGGSVIPRHPIIFSKVPQSIVATNTDVLIDPTVSTAIDHEAELAVIIGGSGRGISKENVRDHVWDTRS